MYWHSIKVIIGTGKHGVAPLSINIKAKKY